MTQRKIWLDNVRWVTVLLVLLYHLFYIFNAQNVFGGLGPLRDVQYQDAVMYLLYPWFMLLLFTVAGMSSRYALERKTEGEFLRSRTLKLLVPSTIGLFILHWITGYINILNGGQIETIPAAVRYPVFALTGTGPLWFIQDLWLFSLLLLLIRKIFPGAAKPDSRPARWWHYVLLALVPLLLWWLSQRYLPKDQGGVITLESGLSGLLNLYRPFYYFTAFLAGYFILAKEDVQERLARWSLPLGAAATLALIVYTVLSFGQNCTGPEHLAQPWIAPLAWLSVMAMLAVGRRHFTWNGRFAGYMIRSSFGLYIVHYVVLIVPAYLLGTYTALPPVVIYLLCGVALFAGSPLLYELLRRIPFIRWCVLGIGRKKQ